MLRNGQPTHREDKSVNQDTEKKVKDKELLEAQKTKMAIEEDATKAKDQKIMFVPGYIEKDSSLENFEEIEAVQELIKEEQSAEAKKGGETLPSISSKQMRLQK